MGIILQVTLNGDIQFLRKFHRFTRFIDNFSSLWPRLRELFWEMEQKQFDSEGGYGSGGWAALDSRYAAWKGKKFPGRPILVLSGDLRGSLTSHAKGSVYHSDEHMMEIGSSIPYGIYHQKGTAKMPMRKPIELSARERARWRKAMRLWLREQRKKMGL